WAVCGISVDENYITITLCSPKHKSSLEHSNQPLSRFRCVLIIIIFLFEVVLLLFITVCIFYVQIRFLVVGLELLIARYYLVEFQIPFVLMWLLFFFFTFIFFPRMQDKKTSPPSVQE